MIEVNVAGFRIMVFPVAMAEASCQNANRIGKSQETIPINSISRKVDHQKSSISLLYFSDVVRYKFSTTPPKIC